MADENIKEFEELKAENEKAVMVKELGDKLEKMKADKDRKCKVAKEQLVDMLKVTVDKYRTATGTAEALRVLRFVVGDDGANLTWANRLAWDMAVETDKLRKKAEKLAYAEMDKLCDGFYEKEFKTSRPEGSDDCYKLAFEMMRIDLCRNVGGSAEDMVAFCTRIDEEIDATGKKLKELKAEKED